MVQLTILNGKMAGQTFVARHFPFLIGRAASAHLVLEGDGVWERHMELHLQREDGIHLQAQPGALVALNRQRVEEARLRNGDLLELGSVKIRFWLTAAAQSSLRPRELLTWMGLGLLFALQFMLIYRLLG